MHYELWDTASGNLLYDFETEVRALEAVRGLVRRNGSGATDSMALVRVEDASQSTVVSGAELVQRALVARAQRTRRSA